MKYISHEIRTPLNVAYMGLQLLEEESDPLVVKDIVKDSTSACSTAINILNDLLLFDKVEEGKMILDRAVVAVRPLLFECLRLFHLQVRGAGLDYKMSL